MTYALLQSQLGVSNSKKIEYSDEALRQDLRRIKEIWYKMQQTRSRVAIYEYLKAVYALIEWWTADGRVNVCVRRSLNLRFHRLWKNLEPYSVIIHCTSNPTIVDRKQRSKWSRALRYVAVKGVDSADLSSFMRAKGGLNACAAYFGIWRKCNGKNVSRFIKRG